MTTFTWRRMKQRTNDRENVKRFLEQEFNEDFGSSVTPNRYACEQNSGFVEHSDEYRKILSLMRAAATQTDFIGPRTSQFTSVFIEAIFNKILSLSRIGRLGVVVTLALIFSTAWLTWSIYAHTSDFATGPGQQMTTVLPDGSVVHLNTRTRISVEYNEKLRKIILHQGEALFDVSPNEARPFEVLAGNTSVLAVGTLFDVYSSEGGKTTVAVLGGKVLVEQNIRKIAIQKSKPTKLTVGDQLTYDRKGYHTKTSNLKFSRIYGWREGKLVFNSERLADVVSEINRYSKTEVVLGDSNLENNLVTGVFKMGRTDAIISAIEKLFGLAAVERSGKIVLVSDASANNL